FTGWMPADPILSVLVALLVLRGAWVVVRGSGHILLEGAPDGFDGDLVARDLAANIAEVENVHHVHAWSITQERPMITLHARISDNAAPEPVRAAIKARLAGHHSIAHATVEIKHGRCADGAD
ncbi:MAG: cation transporter, partial [Hyphomicrobiales bacterium]